jgi:hypothetical protein
MRRGTEFNEEDLILRLIDDILETAFHPPFVAADVVAHDEVQAHAGEFDEINTS